MVDQKRGENGKLNFKFRKNLAIFALIAAIAVTLFAPLHTGAYAAGAELRYYAVDVGQGDCSLFILPNGQTIVVDAGTRKSSKSTVQYLKSCGVKKIDLLVATHPHEDHIGGMTAVLNAFPVTKVWDSGYNHGSKTQTNFLTAVKEKGIRFGRPKRGFTEKMGDVKIDVLAPVKTLKGTHSDANNNGIVMLITYGKVSFLMTGDMEREERATISPLPHANILKAAHHGSSNGTDAKLLKEVSPMIIILSYAVGNSYGHPHDETVEAIRDAGILRFDTANGAVKIRTDGQKITYEKGRVVK